MADCDGDGYFHDGNLVIDVNASSGTHSIYLKLWIKPSSSSYWQEWGTTACFNITYNSSGDTYTWEHPFIYDITKGTYDFMVRAYECGSAVTVASRAPADDPDLDDVRLEKTGEDIPNVWISSTSWSNIIDYDLDGYSRSRKLNFRVYTDCLSTTVDYVIEYYSGIANGWEPITCGDVSEIRNGTSALVSSTISGLSHNEYDFRLLLVTDGWPGDCDDDDYRNYVIFTYSPTVLQDQAFELSTED